MRKLNIKESVNLGGHKFSMNDFNTLQNSVLDVAKVVASLLRTPITNTAYIIAGCDNVSNSGLQFSINAGWLYYNGELYRVLDVPATTITPPHTGVVYFQLNQAPLYPAVSYQSGAQFQVHIENQAQLRWASALPTGGIALNDVDFNSLGKIISDFSTGFQIVNTSLNAINAAWTNITGAALTGAFVELTNSTSAVLFDTATSYYRHKKVGKTLFIQVYIEALGAWDTAKIYFPNTPRFTTNVHVLAYSSGTATRAAFVFDNAAPAGKKHRYTITQGAGTSNLELQTFIEVS